MNSIFEKHKTLVLCALVAAMIVAVGTVAVTWMEAKTVSAVPAAEQAETNGEIITITVKADGNEMKLLTGAATVGEALEGHSISIGEHDILTPAAETKLEDGMEVSIQRIEFRKEVVKETVPYKTETKGVDTLPQGESRVVTQGVNGKDKVTYNVKYVDGVEVAREEVSRENIKAPVTEVI